MGLTFGSHYICIGPWWSKCYWKIWWRTQSTCGRIACSFPHFAFFFMLVGWLACWFPNSICSPRLKEGHLAIIPTDSPWLVKAMLPSLWPGTADDSSQSGAKVLHSLLPSSLPDRWSPIPSLLALPLFCAVTPPNDASSKLLSQLIYRKKRETQGEDRAKPRATLSNIFSDS